MEVVEPQHVPGPGDDFMPYGWCGACEICDAMENKDICTVCSYTETNDLRAPHYWPCSVEQERVRAEKYSDYYKRYGPADEWNN